MGAWIETPVLASTLAIVAVAPYMGAWIETLMSECLITFS